MVRFAKLLGYSIKDTEIVGAVSCLEVSHIFSVNIHVFLTCDLFSLSQEHNWTPDIYGPNIVTPCPAVLQGL